MPDTVINARDTAVNETNVFMLKMLIVEGTISIIREISNRWCYFRLGRGVILDWGGGGSEKAYLSK